MLTNDLKNLKILVVEDDYYQGKVIRRMLNFIGIDDVETDSEAKTALEKLKMPGDTIDIVICDLDMPDMDGIEFLRLLAETKNVTCSFIVLSAKAPNILRSVELMAQEYRLDMLGVLEKPAMTSTMKEMLSRHLTRIKLRRNSQYDIRRDEVIAALDADQFEPFFQPKVDIQSQRICGVEALVRWRHPKHGILSPATFIDTIEKNDLMDQLTWLVVNKSAEHLRRWHNAGLEISVSFNACLTVLTNSEFSSHLLDIISNQGLYPSYWIVEVTEGSAMTHIAHSLESLSRLRMKGFGLSIDDFGTGHSSLQQLTRIPYSELKIDRAFITGAASQPSLQSIVESTVYLAHKLGLKTVGEGVETIEDWICFMQAGGDMVQGYFCAKPMPANDIATWAGGRENMPFLTENSSNSI